MELSLEFFQEKCLRVFVEESVTRDSFLCHDVSFTAIYDRLQMFQEGMFSW